LRRGCITRLRPDDKGRDTSRTPTGSRTRTVQKGARGRARRHFRLQRQRKGTRRIEADERLGERSSRSERAGAGSATTAAAVVDGRYACTPPCPEWSSSTHAGGAPILCFRVEQRLAAAHGAWDR
jgi:hypothetical protein